MLDGPPCWQQSHFLPSGPRTLGLLCGRLVLGSGHQLCKGCEALYAACLQAHLLYLQSHENESASCDLARRQETRVRSHRTPTNPEEGSAPAPAGTSSFREKVDLVQNSTFLGQTLCILRSQHVD